MVSVTSTRRTSSSPSQSTSLPRNDERAFLSKWLKIWVGLLSVVTLVVVAYLTLITNSLADINGNLGVVSREVGASGANTLALPAHVDRINGSLTQIDTALQPIPDQAGAIVSTLESINGKLAQTDGSLKDTAGTLQTILSSAGNINTTLIDADEPADNLGVQDIHQRIARANGRNSPRVGTASAGGTPGSFGATPGNLADAQLDTRVIVGRLDAVNSSLTGVCSGLILSVTSILSGGACTS